MRISDWSSDVCSSDLSPLSRLFIDSFSDPQTGAFTFGNIIDIASRERYLTAYLHTLELAGATVAISLFLALPMAWAVSRTTLWGRGVRSEEHTSELQSLMRISYAVFCLKKKNKT